MEGLEVWEELTAAEASGFTDGAFGPEAWFPEQGDRDQQHTPKVRRWSEAHPGLALFDGGLDVRDVHQGALGSAWFLGALSALARRPELLRRPFLRSESGGNFEAGVFGVQLFEASAGGWRRLLLDDRFPVDGSGRLKLARSLKHREIWPSVLEKALAKHCGSYQAVAGGTAPQALHMLTGAFVEAYHHRFLRRAGADDLWERLSAALDAGNVGACSIVPGVDRGDSGLIGKHAYGLLACRCLEDGTRLVQVKNPWGLTGEWQGDWGDKSARWTATALASFGRDPARTDGTFWMPWPELLKRVDSLGIAYIEGPPGELRQTEVLRNRSAEVGSMRGDRLWLTGRKFRVRSTSQSEEPVFFTILSGPGTSSVIWGFADKGDLRLRSTLREENLVVDGSHEGGRVNCARCSLPPGEALVFLVCLREETPYVAQAVGKGVELEVLEHEPEEWARPFAEADSSEVFQVPDGWSQALQTGVWTCHGHGSGPTFGSFQKVWFSLAERADVLVRLEQAAEEEEAFLPIEFYVLSREDWEESVRRWLTDGMVLNKGMVGTRRRSTWSAAPLSLAAGAYCVIPMCNGYLPPENDLDWSVTVASSKALKSCSVERPPVPSVKDEIMESFKQFDKNRDGCIDIEELAALFRTLNGEWGDKDVAALMQVMDRDANGRVSYGEFVDWVFDNGADDDSAEEGPF